MGIEWDKLSEDTLDAFEDREGARSRTSKDRSEGRGKPDKEKKPHPSASPHRDSILPKHPEAFPEVSEWRAWMVRAVDGDTVAVSVNTGFRTFINLDIRVMNYNSPEIVGANKAAGLAARAFVDKLIPPGSPIILHTTRDRRSFNRYLGHVWFYDENGELNDLGIQVVKAGHGEWVK